MATAWFQRKEIHKAIDQISSVDELVIYAGAGVTIDRTNLSWKDLALCLLSLGGCGETIAKAVVTDLGRVPATSGAYGLISAKRGDAVGQSVANDLRNRIYLNQNFMGGQLSSAIAGLALRFARSGRNVTVATTNYDDFLLADAVEHAAARRVLEDFKKTLQLVDQAIGSSSPFDSRPARGVVGAVLAQMLADGLLGQTRAAFMHRRADDHSCHVRSIAQTTSSDLPCHLIVRSGVAGTHMPGTQSDAPFDGASRRYSHVPCFGLGCYFGGPPRSPIGTTARTGQKCPESGVWKVVGTPTNTAPIAKGNTMPPYRDKGLTWKLISYA